MMRQAGRRASWPEPSIGSTPGLAAGACRATGLRLGNRPDRAAEERRRTSGRARYPAANKGHLKRSWCPRPVAGGAPSLLHLLRSGGFDAPSRNREERAPARDRQRALQTTAECLLCFLRQEHRQVLIRPSAGFSAGTYGTKPSRARFSVSRPAAVDPFADSTASVIAMHNSRRC